MPDKYTKRCSEILIREMQIKTTVNITSHRLECLLEDAKRASWSDGPVVKNQLVMQGTPVHFLVWEDPTLWYN